MSLDQVIVYWGDGLRGLLGYRSGAVVGRPCWRLGTGVVAVGLTDDCRAGCACLRAARVGVVPSPVELDMRAAWGEVKRVRVVPVALGHLGWIDRLLVYVLVSATSTGDPHRDGARAGLERVVDLEKVALTAREREVMVLVARGWRNALIAQELGIALNTVRTHVANVRGKLGVSTRLEATMVALRLGLIDSD